MTLASIITDIRNSHDDCCIDHSSHYFEDEGIRLEITRIGRDTLTALNGHQLSSRTILGKGGSATESSLVSQTAALSVPLNLRAEIARNMSVAINQIQRGLELLASLLQNASPQKWFPFLVYSGSMSKQDRNLQRKKTVSFRGRRSTVERIDDRSSLLNYLNRH